MNVEIDCDSSWLIFIHLFLQSSEYEEYSDSDEENGLRLKPVFVRKYAALLYLLILHGRGSLTNKRFCFRNDRVTVHEREKMQEDDMSEEKHKKLVEERKRQSARVKTALRFR